MSFSTKDGVQTLLASCVQAVVHNISEHENNLTTLPIPLKDHLLHLMSKRGLLTDETIMQILHRRVPLLDLTECEISNRGLQHIAATCPYLKKLDLNAQKEPRQNITSEGLLPIAQRCHFLQVVYLRRCIHLTDSVLIALSQNCRTLRDLNIGGCPNITDASLTALGNNCSHLRSLNVSKANVTDNGIFNLVNGTCSTSLKELHMNSCVQLSDESVEAVIQFCPQLTILIFHGCPNITDESRVSLEELLHRQDRTKVTQLTWTVY